MERFLKRIIAGVLGLAIVFLTACSGNENDKKSGQENEKGRYIETEYALPDGVGGVMTMGRLEDGSLRLASDIGMFDSADGGQTWEPSMNGYIPVMIREDESYLMGSAIDTKGRLFLAYTGKHYLVDENGEENEVPLELPGEQVDGVSLSDEEEGDSFKNSLSDVKFTDDGKVVGVDYGGTAYLVNLDSGEIEQTFVDEADNYILNFAVVGNRLVTLNHEEINIYNMETGTLEETEAGLSDYFAENNSGEPDGIFRLESIALRAARDDENTMYYGDNTGLYRYVFGGGEMERLINGSLASMSNPALDIGQFMEMDNNTFLILYQGAQGESLMHYEYSEEASAVPLHEIKVYALNDNQSIRQAIANFQSSNPDYYVNLEIGMSGDDSITASDAISTLNTNIMAGNGPDVILLDQLPADTYIEKGLLEDLSDVVKECKKENTFLDDILNYKKTDKGLYAVPTRFSLPFVAGNDETLKHVNDLGSLAAEVKRLRSEDGEVGSILGPKSAESLLETLLNISMAEMMKADGTLDKTVLTEYLEAAKEIYDANYQPKDGDEMHSITFGGLNPDVLTNMMTILGGQQKMNIGTLNSLSEAGSLVSMNDEVKWGYHVMDGLSKNVFIPRDLIGVSAKSEEKEAANLFVKYLLAEDNQSNTQAYGFPVNADALEKSYDIIKDQESSEVAIAASNEDGTELSAEMTLRSISEEEFDQVKAYLSAAKTAAANDAVIAEAIINEGAAYLKEGTDVNETADKILQNVNLCLAE